MTRPGPLDYINKTYGLTLRSGSPVVQPSTGRRGVVVGPCPGAQHYLMIRWDGCPHVARESGCGCSRRRAAHGPFHPTDGLEYPEAPALPLQP